MRDSWIRLKATFRSAVIAPFRGLAGPLKNLVVTPEGKTRWVPIGALVFVSAVSIAGILINVLQGLGGQPPQEQPAPPVAAPSETADAPKTEQKVLLRGSDVELNPPTKLDKNGRVEFLATDSPGALAEAYTRASSTMDMSKDTAQGWLDTFDQWHTTFVPSGFEEWAWGSVVQTETRAGIFNVWAKFAMQEPTFQAFTTGVVIDRELGDGQSTSDNGSAPKWAAQIDSGAGVHLVRTSYLVGRFRVCDQELFKPGTFGPR